MFHPEPIGFDRVRSGERQESVRVMGKCILRFLGHPGAGDGFERESGADASSDLVAGDIKQAGDPAG